MGELRLIRKKFSTLHYRWIGDMVQANASAIRTRLRRNGCEFDLATPWQGDCEFREDLLDIATIEQRRHEPGRPLREYLADRETG